MLKVGIVGANWGLIAHKPAWETLPGVEVVAVCTAHEHTARKAARRFGVPRAYGRFEDLLHDPDIDILDVGTRPDLRRDMVVAALGAGRHVFASANFAASIEAARAMRDAARIARRVCVLDTPLMWNAAHRHAKALVAANALGRPVAAAVRFAIPLFTPGSPHGAAWRWFAKRAHGASALRNLGTHALHVLVDLLGPIEAVAAVDATAQPRWQFDDEIVAPEVEDTAFLLLRFASGALGSVQTGWASPALLGWRMELTGDAGVLVTEDAAAFPSNATIRMASGRNAATLAPYELPDELRDLSVLGRDTAPDPPHIWDIATGMLDMVEAIRGGGVAQPDFERAFHVEAVLWAARQAADQRRWVETREAADRPA